MRLIDADYVTEKLNEINGTAELDKAFEVVENAPTVDVLDKIKGEIEDYVCNHETNTDKAQGMLNALQILDKYR